MKDFGNAVAEVVGASIAAFLIVAAMFIGAAFGIGYFIGAK